MKKLTVLLFTSLAFLTCLFSQNYNNTLRSTMSFPGQNLANIAGYWQNGKEYALVGASAGLVIVDITDPDNPSQIGQYNGPNNRWKEIKTYKNFAYVTSEGGGGVQIFDLSNLPNQNVPNHYYTGTANAPKAMTNIHALHIDTTAGFLYCFGGNYSGASIHNLNTDPYNPTYVAQYQGGGYIHDGYADNDTLYACHIYAGRMEIVDMRNKSNPQLLGGVTTPNAFPHNAWLLPGNKHILTTDERSNSWLACYDISDPTDIFEVDRMQTTPGSGSIVHNTHVTGHYAVSSWYRDGYNIVDAFRPNNLVQVGSYDTWPQGSGNGFSGCWGVYPFFPSGTIIASNINPAELFIFTPDYKEACYVEGTVTDACTGLDISDATISINSTDPLFDTKTNNNGIFRTGQPTAGDFTVTVEKAGYLKQTFDVTLAPHDVINLNVQMQNLNNVIQLPDFNICQGEVVTVCGTNYTASGSYTATCGSAGNCDSVFAFNIVLADAIAEIIGDTALTCSNPSITLNHAATAGYAAWYNANGTSLLHVGQGFTVNQAGTYILLVEGSGCLVFDTITVANNNTPPNLTGTAGTINCMNATVSLNASSSDPNLSYAWAGPNGFSASGAIAITDEAGTYTVTGTNSAGCTSMEIVEVSMDTQGPDIQSLIGGSIGCNNSSTNISVVAPTAIAFAWTDALGVLLGTDATLTVSSPGDYTITAFGANGCSTPETFTVIQDNTVPDIDILGGSLDCFSPTSSLTANSSISGLSYLWSTNEVSQVIQVSSPGTYSVTVTSLNGCTNSAVGTADYFIPPPTVSVDDAHLDCINQGADLIANTNTPNPTYQWSTNETTWAIGVDVVGTYTVTVTEGDNGCTATATAVVTQDIDVPNVSVSNGTLNCAVTSAGITASSTTSNLTYQWSSGQTDATIFVNAAGTYTVTATGANGCTNVATASVTSDNTTPDLQIITGGDLSCAIPLVDVFAQSTAGVTFTWTGPNGFTSTQTGFGVSQPGTYCVVVTDANGCTASDCISISANTSIPQVVSNAPVIDCNNPTAEILTTVSFSGSVTYEWNNGQTSPNLTTNIPGTYSVTVTGDNGCTSSATVVVNEDTDIPDLDITGGIITCSNPFTDITAQTNVGGSYSWVGPSGSISTQQTVTVGDPGTYCVTFTDFQGCSAEECITIGVDAGIPDVTATGGTLNCFNNSVMIVGSSTTPNVSLEWTGPNGFTSTNPNASVSTPGDYILTVTDLTNGCTITATTTVNEDFSTPAFSIFGGGGVIYCSGPVPLNIIPPTNNNTFEWVWPDGTTSTGDTLSATLNGTYTVIGTHPNSGCTSSETTDVILNIDVPVLTMPQPDLLDCCITEVQLLLDISSGSTITSIEWFDSNNNSISVQQQPFVNTQGSYTVVVTNDNGCTSSLMTTVASLFNAPDITATGGTITCTMPTVTLDAQSNVSNATFSWTGSNGFSSTDQNPMVDMDGSYTVEVTNVTNCCTASATVIVVDSCSVSIVDLEKEGNIKVYPNATSGLLNIESTISTTSIQAYTIFDENGRRIQEQIIPNQQLVQLDLSEQEDGMYVLKLLADGRWWSVQVVLLK